MMAVNEFWRFSSRNRVGHEHHPLTAARRNLILELWSSGMTKDEIALAVDIDEDTISRHFRAARKAGDARAVIRHPATALAMATVRLTAQQATNIVDRVMTAQQRRGATYVTGTREKAIAAGLATEGVDPVTNAIDGALHAGMQRPEKVK